MTRTLDVLAAIDNALADEDVSEDAMRWAPDAEAVAPAGGWHGPFAPYTPSYPSAPGWVDRDVLLSSLEREPWWWPTAGGAQNVMLPTFTGPREPVVLLARFGALIYDPAAGMRTVTAGDVDAACLVWPARGGGWALSVEQWQVLRNFMAWPPRPPRPRWLPPELPPARPRLADWHQDTLVTAAAFMQALGWPHPRWQEVVNAAIVTRLRAAHRREGRRWEQQPRVRTVMLRADRRALRRTRRAV